MPKYEADPDQSGLVRYGPDGRCVWCDAEGPAPARDPWVPVAEAPEDRRERYGVLGWTGTDWFPARWRRDHWFCEPGQYPTLLMPPPPNPPKGD